MKKLLLALALSVLSVCTLHAQTIIGSEKPDLGRLTEPSALVLAIAGISGVGLWLRSRRYSK